MKLLAAAIGAVVLVAAGIVVLGRVYALGPLAPGAPPSWVYVAIARSEDGASREIEVIDVAGGGRQVFSVDRRVFDLALSPDRRSLYLGSQDGVIVELDAVRGVFLRELRVSAPGDVLRLLPLPDGRRLAALTLQTLDSSLSLVDLGSGRETGRVELGRRIVGRFVTSGDRLLVPAGDRGGTDSLLELTLDPLRLDRETMLFSSSRGVLQTSAPTAARTKDGVVAVLSPFSLRIAVLTAGDVMQRRDVDLGAIFFAARPTGFQGDVDFSTDGAVLHVCLGGNILGERYRVPLPEAVPARSGSECGGFVHAADGTLYLGVRAKPELRIIDGRSGETRRVLPLAGIPVRLGG